ncbi:MAG: putative tricarboxylic transport rane protein [Clostridiales bacterium]|nr:putative tricarboxylic transport rane protein [Clostridiales bacterium]MDK2933240.1 putative tricarboxylic transport rane protein [Clostridiales bacterium]
MKRKILCSILIVVMLVSFTVSFTGCQKNTWPNKPINLVVSSSAGGGTDLGNRALAAALEKELGQKITVVNVPAGGGGAAANQVFSAPHDGYNLLGFFEGIFSFAVMNAHKSTTKDWEYFILGGTPGVLSVRADSPWNSVEDVIKAMKDKPGEIKLANSSVGCIWDIKAALLKEAAGLDYKFMPYQGSNPSILALLSGEVDVVITGVGEQAEFLEAKKLKPLAMIELEDHDVPGYKGVPSITKAVPAMKDVLPLDQTIGFAVPSDVPKEVLDKLDAAFKKAIQSEEVQKYAKTKFVRISGKSGADAKEIGKKMESIMSWILYDKKVAPKSPEEFGIARPKK